MRQADRIARAAERRGRVRELHASGHSQVEIARILGASPSAIANDFEVMDLPRPGSRANYQARREAFVRMANEGYSRAQISRELGLSEGRLRDLEVITHTPIKAGGVMGKSRRFDADKFMTRFTDSLSDKVATLSAIESAVDEIDPGLARASAERIEDVITALSLFRRRLIKQSLTMKESPT